MIELYGESIADAGAPTSAPSTNVEQATATVCTMADEISPVALEPSTTDGPIDKPPMLRSLQSSKFFCFVILRLHAKNFF